MLQALLLAAALAAPQTALLHPQDFQDYVEHWSPASAPLCRVFTSAASWAQTLHPAAVMGAHRPFAPREAFWRDHAVLFVARTIYAGPADDVLKVRRITRASDGLAFDYTYSATPPSSSTMNWWVGAAVEKPLPRRVVFRENGRTVCTVSVTPGAGSRQ